MSKIICDVCGTSYPETVTQCPICGCVRSVDAKVVAGSTNEAENQAASTYTYVKGGRFSKSNVKKRNNGNKQTASAEDNVQPAQPVQNEGKKDTGVIITTIVLLLAIVAVVVYIAMRFFAPSLSMGEKPDNNSNTAETTLDVTDNTDDTTETTLLEIPCTEVVLSKTLVEFDEVGQSLLLNVTLTPEDTTEDILFATSDESVVTINNDGKLTAMGGGEAIITVICGNVVAECNVICNIEVPTVETEPSAPSADDFKLNREDFTMTQKGQIWKLYSGDIAANQITWTSDNENIVTIKDGIVTAVGSGTTKVHGEYGGVKVSCIVRCSAAVGTADSGSNNTENTPQTSTPETSGKYTISDTDVTLPVGTSFTLTLKDSNGNPVNVGWISANTSICTVNGNTVTGVTGGTNGNSISTKVYTTYEGAEYSCIVRVK